MLQVILGVIRCISDFQKPCVSKTAGLGVKDTSRSPCYPDLCGHCLPSCQAERQAPGVLVSFSLTWDPIWAKTSKRYSSLKSPLSLFNLFWFFFSVVLTKVLFWIFEILIFWFLTNFYLCLTMSAKLMKSQFVRHLSSVVRPPCGNYLWT